MTQVPAPTRLLHEHDSDDTPSNDDTVVEPCSFCGVATDARLATDVINYNYFNDHPLMRADTGYVCIHCAYCMGTNDLKRGHWLVTEDTFLQPSTGDLYALLDNLASNAYEPPLALHVSANPIRSEHAYIWTPVSLQTDPLTLDYDGHRIHTDLNTLFDIIHGIEILRRHGFRVDDIRTGQHRVRDIESLGVTTYRQLTNFLDRYRGAPRFDLALTVSRSESDQPSDAVTPSTLLDKYD